MSGRQYAIQTWVKHDDSDPRLLTDPESDNWGYSGEQLGDRKRSSKEGFLANGKADIASAADRNEAYKDNPLFKVDPAYKVLAGYTEQLDNLDKALHEKLIPYSVYEQAVRLIHVKQHKAQQKIDKLLAVELPEDEDNTSIETEETIKPQAWENMGSTDLTQSERLEALWYYENGIHNT